MSRPSSIDKLEAPIRAEINRLRVDKGFTLDQILGHLKAMDVSVSRSALGRHVQKIEEVGARIRQTRAVAAGVAQALRDKDEGEIAQVNIELLHGVVMTLATATDDDGQDVPISPQQAMALSKAMDHLARAEKTNADRILKVRNEIGKNVKQKIEAIAADAGAGAEPPAAADVLKRIREDVYGIFDEPGK
jgi:hypothetical protein